MDTVTWDRPRQRLRGLVLRRASRHAMGGGASGWGRALHRSRVGSGPLLGEDSLVVCPGCRAHRAFTPPAALAPLGLRQALATDDPVPYLVQHAG